MFIDFMTDVFEKNRHSEAIVWQDQVYSYDWLLEHIQKWREQIEAAEIQPGAVTVLEADFSPNSIALFLALIDAGCILVPLTSSVQSKRDEFIAIVEGEFSIRIDAQDQVSIEPLGNHADQPLYTKLRAEKHPGLILFSSGSTGKNKAALHDFVPILEKFSVPRQSLRTLTFLLYDHIGGVNTMLYNLSNAGCIVTTPDRNPDAVLEKIEKYRVELLPTSPTFINLILLSEAHSRHDLSSLKLITYGTEPMPETTLSRFHRLFPDIRLQQTYGLSELGILRSKSKDSDSLWVKVGGEGFQTRIVDGILHIKARSAMLGYLNAPDPFTKDGWLNTNDVVEQQGEYLKILGRQSEIINVGGEKVFPAEVESVIQELDNVADVTVYGQSNTITGQIVCATVTLQEPEDPKIFKARLKTFCRKQMQPYKVPVKIRTTDALQHGARFKRMRNSASQASDVADSE